MDPIRVIASTDAYLFAATGPVMVCVWRARVQQEGLEVFLRACETLRAEHPRFVVIGTAEPDAPPPEGVIRRGLTEAMRAQGNHLHGVAFIVEGTGFRAATVRSVAIGLSLLLPFPFRIVSSMEQACAWAASRLELGAIPVPSSLYSDVVHLRLAPVSF